MLTAEIEIKVPFYDVDPLQIVWHGNYVRYLELARCAALESIHYGYQEMQASGYSFPVTDLSLRYTRPARFGQQLRVRAELTEWEHRLRFRYAIRDADSGERLTRGETVQLAVDLRTGELCFVCPPVLFEKLGVPPP